ncbi:unnamed protein product [Rangifer tarandus platyrhynchus]|uniref:Collagen alpha-1(I) chain-like n=1 Tax=Rangifer tarandus platyrhynchus TaxID=3082113 RepID=A0ABN8XVI2_RANTA|nr:unnamed protein product [Rangifer tarandus platyrhynchus]
MVGVSPPEACREERRQARWPAGCIIPALRAVCDALAKCQERSKNPPVTPRSQCPHTPYTPTPPPRARSPPEFVSLHRRVCAAGIAGGAERPAQPGSSSRSALARDPRPCRCSCRAAAASDAGEVGPRLAGPPGPHPAPASSAPRAGSSRPEPLARPLHFPRPSPVPAENNGANSGVSALLAQRGTALWRGPLVAAPAAGGRWCGAGGVAAGRTQAAGSISINPPRFRDLPLARAGADTRDAARTGAAQAGEGRDGAKKRKAEGAPGRGRGWRGPAGGEGVPGGGAQAEALVPGVGEGGCWSREQNRRGLRWEGWLPAWCAPPELPRAQPRSRPSLETPFSLPESPTVWEGPPADKACIHAGGAPVTGVARRQEGRGLRGRDVSAGGALRAPGLG